MVAMLLNYQRVVKEVMAYKPKTRKEAEMVFNIKQAMWDYQNENLIPFQKVQIKI